MAWIDYGNGAPGRNAGYSKQRWQQDYDAYLARIEQYKGTAFYDQLLNNPYMQYQEFDGNIFQQLWSDFTGNTQYIDNFYNDRKTSADEYMSQVMEAARQQGYNDPSSELARRRAAGLNDDLNGGQAIGAGETGSVVPDETPPAPPEDNSLQVAGQVASLGMSLFQSGLSMITFLQDVAGKRLDNGMKDLALTGEGYDQAIKMLAGSSSMPGSRAEYDALSEDEKAGLDDQLIKQLEASLVSSDRKSMYQTRTARRLMGHLRGVVSYDKDGKPTLAYEAYRSKLLAERYGSHKEAAEVIGTPGFSENVMDFGKQIADTYGAIDLAIRKAQKRIDEARARSAEVGADYDVSRLGSDLGAAEKAAGIAEAGARQTQAENVKIIEDMRKEINEQFDALWEFAKTKQGLEGLILRLLIPSARSQTEQIINQGFGATLIDRSGVGPFVGSLVK